MLNDKTKQIVFGIFLAYVLGLVLLGFGFLLGTTQVTNNYYYEDRETLLDLYPLTINPTCPSCHLSSETVIQTSEKIQYNIHIDNLTLNHSYLLMLPEELILFTYFYEDQLFDLFALTYIAGEVDNITIRLYELFTNPFIYRVSEIGDINDLILLDLLVIKIDV
jgi:hypothetical protein